MDGSGQALILHVFPTFAVGGAQVRFCAVANRFGPRWQHAVVSLDGRWDCAQRLDPSVVLHQVPSPAQHGDTARNLPRIRALLRRLRPAVLVTSNWGSIEWAMANLLPPRIRHLHTEDGFGPDESNGQIRRRVVTRRLVLARSTVVLPSARLLQAATDVWRLPPSRLHHVPNGIDLRRFHPDGSLDASAQAPPVSGSGPLIGTVAALRPEKNLAVLLRAAEQLIGAGQAMRLAIIGDGPERARLQALAAELGIAAFVTFPGAVADPAAAYRCMDLFALSSDTEQMPFSVLEAMASGLPIAATDVGDVRRMLSAANAPHVCPPGDVDALAAALRPLVDDAALRRRLGAANRAKAEQAYDEETMFLAYAALLDGVAVKGPAPATYPWGRPSLAS